jgi:hypothetical protein
MRRLLPTIPLILLATGPTLADEATDLRDKALAAAAKDPADLKKFQIYTLKAKGKSHLTGEPLDARFDLAAVWPGRVRTTWEFGGGANKQTATKCAVDDQGWQLAPGLAPTELTPEEQSDFRTDAYAVVFTSTLLTLSDAKNTLTPAGRSKVSGDPVAGLKVSRRPWPDITLYFDEKTNLLRKMTWRSRQSGVMLTKEMLFGGHKEVGGLMLPTKQATWVDGREIYTYTEMEFGFPDKIDTSTFQKP